MFATSSNMTSMPMVSKDCLSSGKYKCADGQCVRGGPGLCPWSDKCNAYVLRRYFCPVTGWCEVSDTHCLRPCGFRQQHYSYKYNCSGFPGLCGVTSSHCPLVCDHEKPYKCHDDVLPGVCAKGKNWCEHCFGYRCQIDGECIMNSQICDGDSNCSDGEDEMSCDIGRSSRFSADFLNLNEWQVAGLLGGIFIIFLLCFYWCWRAASKGDMAESLANSRQNQQTSSGPRVTGTRSTPAAVIEPPVVRVRDVYTQRPSNTARANPLSESGFYVPVASVPSNDSPRSAAVSTAPRGYGGAASSLSESGFYVPRASVPSDGCPSCITVVSSAPRGYTTAASSSRRYSNAANADTSSEESPTIGPPPSYEEAIQSDDQNHQKDPMLPSYEEVVEGTPADKQTFL